jgi:hypothetical protein
MSNQAWHDQRLANRLEDLRWLADTGETRRGAADRLGVGYRSLEKWADRHARVEWQRLKRNEEAGRVRRGSVGLVMV